MLDVVVVGWGRSQTEHYEYVLESKQTLVYCAYVVEEDSLCCRSRRGRRC